MWSADFKGDFGLGNGTRCHPLTIADNVSRLVAECRALERTDTESVRPWFEWAFREHGLPLCLRSDNGPPFASTGAGGLTRLSKWLVRLGVRPQRIRPGKPQENGRHERMHRSMKAAIGRPARTLAGQQRILDRFVEEFNWERSHEALGMRTPGSVHRASPRPFPERLPEVGYGEGVAVRRVRRNGEIKWRGDLVYLSSVLPGEPVGLTPLEGGDGLWEVRFSFHLLGVLDERTGKVRPTEGWHREPSAPEPGETGAGGPEASFRRLLSTRIDDDYTEYYLGEYLDLGLAVLADFEWGRLDVLAGARYDIIDMRSRQPVDKLLLPSSNNFCTDASCVVVEAADEVDGVSWTFSLSFDAGAGLRPYVTVSRQATVIAGQGAEIATASIRDGVAFDESTLFEYGLKGSLLDDQLYFALSIYEQERTDYSAQQTVTNQASRSEGKEFELRWAATERLLLTLGYSGIEVVNLNTLEAGGRFSFIGADDLPGIPPGALYGGALGGQVLSSGRVGAGRAGIPEDVWSVTTTYDIGRGFAASASVVDVAGTFSGYSRSVRLPAYTLVNVGLLLELENWVVGAVVKNLTDERYFRANFPNLFGGVVVLPELPRHFAARIEYRW